ncbi:hypothetical protein [Shewanella xiamenensis]|uniref:hypothetical protein n=1 Tax=Shewanella xiamenensis TaxID=332186 RepID=UPI001C4F9495|nr:hypothetical protein [Shewanella xiamenensis]
MNNVNFQEELSAKTTTLTLLTNLGVVTLQKFGQLMKFCNDGKKFLWHALGQKCANS